MPYENPGGGQDADMFSDGPEVARSKEPETPPETQTAIVPKSLCPGMNPGDTLQLKIVASHDSDYEVEYSHEDEKESPEEGETPPEEAMAAGAPAGAPGGGEMASMME